MLPLWPAAAQDTQSTATAAPASSGMLVELNKAEQTDGGCHYFLLLRNSTEYDFELLRLDLYFFDTAGVISKRLLVSTPPVGSGDTRGRGLRGHGVDLQRRLADSRQQRRSL